MPCLGLSLAWVLEARAKLADLVSTHATDGNLARKTENKKERHGGISLSRNGSISLFFRFAYILFVIHRDEYRVTRWSADSRPDPCHNQVLHINVYKKVLGVLRHLLARGPTNIL